MAGFHPTHAADVALLVERQQQQIERLEGENRELRRQLAEMRRGVGLAILIDGRAIPLATLPSAEVAGRHVAQVQADNHAHPHVTEATSAGGFRPVRLAATEHPAPSGPTFAEDGWLTDSGAVPRVESRREQVVSFPVRPLTPSQEMTPSWLRDEPSQQGPMPISAPVYPSARAAESPPDQANGDTGRETVAYPYPGRRRVSPTPMRTLAQITGQHRAVGVTSGGRQRTPYTDSFVLG